MTPIFMPTRPPQQNSTQASPEPKKPQPRGSKLDAQKRAVYEAEVAKAANWDTSGWPTWTVTGRVLPERCNVRVPPRTAQGIGAGGRYKLRIEVIQSHIAPSFVLPKSAMRVFLKSRMLSAARLLFQWTTSPFKFAVPMKLYLIFALTIKAARR
jgi:hypothetical protein